MSASDWDDNDVGVESEDITDVLSSTASLSQPDAIACSMTVNAWMKLLWK